MDHVAKSDYPEMQWLIAEKLFDAFQREMNRISPNSYCNLFYNLEARFKLGWLAVAKTMMVEV